MLLLGMGPEGKWRNSRRVAVGAHIRPHCSRKLAASEASACNQNMTYTHEQSGRAARMPAGQQPAARHGRPDRRMLYMDPGRRGQEVSDVRPPGEGNVPAALVFLSACGGVGLSTCLALCAKILAGRGWRCAIVDADLAAGGMDVLLGLETDPGLRLSELEAPLGRMDPDALTHELPKWEGIAVLSSDPWKGAPPQAWDLDAALAAMGARSDLLLVDGAGGQGLEGLEALAGQPRLVLAELSVLGVARTRALLGRVEEGSSGPVEVVGVAPRGVRGAPPVSQGEAEDFLGRPLLAVLKPRAKLATGILEGLGVERIPRSYRKPLAAIGDRAEALAGLGSPKGVWT